MQLDDALKKVSVIGACGKMGRGIAALLLQEMSKIDSGYSLNLIDANSEHFTDLKQYLRAEITKYAEKNISFLRDRYSKNLKLISNQEIIEFFVKSALDSVFVSDSIESASDSFLIFEAILEDPEKKADLFSKIKNSLKHEAYFLTNTSSIPIHELDRLAKLDKKIIGFHFYNPPLVQKLVELIIPEDGDPKLVQLAKELAKRLNKEIVYSNDVAGFIGNGFFMQEIVYACQKAEEFGQIHSDAEGVYLIDVLTKDFLLRPMGIFQLIDYVGIEVCARVLKIMQKYLPEKNLHAELIDQMLLAGKMGGQSAFGLQNPGFFEYEGGVPKSVYSLEHQVYLPLETISKAVHEHLGQSSTLSWKKLQNDASKDEKIKKYFENLKNEKSLGSELTFKFLDHAKESAKKLVAEGVAKDMADVDRVLENGFYHLYGPSI